jgi:sugar-specific transcriptional regulator TrmB
MAENYREALSEYGLSENEIQVYITLIKTGESTAQSIAKNAKLPRTTTYHLLEGLVQKGLVSFVIKETIKYFQAIDPKRLVELLEEKKQRIQQIVPELSAIAATIKEKPKVVIFEGMKGIRAVLQDVLEEKKTIYHYGDIISLQEVLKFAFPQFIRKRVEKKILIKILCKKEDPHKELLKTAKKEFREFVFIPDDYIFKSSVFMYSGKVAIFNIHEEPHYVVIVENKDFYESQKNLFELIWKAYKR